MKRPNKITSCVTILCLAAPLAVGQSTRAPAAVPPAANSCSVRVYGRGVASTSSEPLARALVSIRAQALEAVTGSDGTFDLRRVVPGTLEVYVSAAGYPLMKTRINVPAGGDFEVEFQFGRESLKHREQ